MASNTLDLAGAIRRSEKKLKQSLSVLNATAKLTTAQSESPSTNLHPSLLAILAQLRQNLTALSLAFSGKAVTADAAVAQLEKVTQNAEQLAACVVGCPSGSSLQAEWRRSVMELQTALLQYGQILSRDFQLEPPYAPLFDASSAASSSTTSLPSAQYLVSTSNLWSQIDSFTRTASRTEVEAVKRLWERDGEALQDAQREYKGLLEQDEGLGEEEEDLEDEGEWTELEKEFSASLEGIRLSVAERDRVKALDIIVRLLLSLHTRTAKSILQHLSPQAPLKALLELSSQISSEMDNLISDLYAPQDVDAVTQATYDLVRNGSSLCQALLDDLEAGNSSATRMGAAGKLSLDGQRDVAETPGPLSPIAKELKWLGLWQAQTQKEQAKWQQAVSGA